MLATESNIKSLAERRFNNDALFIHKLLNTYYDRLPSKVSFALPNVYTLCKHFQCPTT